MMWVESAGRWGGCEPGGVWSAGQCDPQALCNQQRDRQEWPRDHHQCYQLKYRQPVPQVAGTTTRDKTTKTSYHKQVLPSKRFHFGKGFHTPSTKIKTLRGIWNLKNTSFVKTSWECWQLVVWFISLVWKQDVYRS